jgi:hypothetical protein
MQRLSHARKKYTGTRAGKQIFKMNFKARMAHPAVPLSTTLPNPVTHRIG